MPDWTALTITLRKHDIHLSGIDTARAVGGGDISAAWKIETDAGPIFLKTGHPDACQMFAAEAEGLLELAQANAVRVPAVLAAGNSQSDCFLALEWLDMSPMDAGTDQLLGEQLARQHRVLADRHGWKRDNTIGRTPQINNWSENWLEFFFDRRLKYQLDLAGRNGFGAKLKNAAAELQKALPDIFSGYTPQPSLLHGDLWGGNKASVGGQPVIFDPAVYYGDRETDLAMTRLFGGFSAAFYESYEEAWPLSEGHEKRLIVYQLYHVLNHLNLFGCGYLSQARSIISALRQQRMLRPESLR